MPHLTMLYFKLTFQGANNFYVHSILNHLLSKKSKSNIQVYVKSTVAIPPSKIYVSYVILCKTVEILLLHWIHSLSNRVYNVWKYTLHMHNYVQCLPKRYIKKFRINAKWHVVHFTYAKHSSHVVNDCYVWM